VAGEVMTIPLIIAFLLVGFGIMFYGIAELRQAGEP
jgi:hypothetical protein